MPRGSKQIRSVRGSAGLAIAALVCGIIGTVIGLLIVIGVIVSLSNSGDY